MTNLKHTQAPTMNQYYTQIFNLLQTTAKQILDNRDTYQIKNVNLYETHSKDLLHSNKPLRDKMINFNIYYDMPNQKHTNTFIAIQTMTFKGFEFIKCCIRSYHHDPSVTDHIYANFINNIIKIVPKNHLQLNINIDLQPYKIREPLINIHL